MDHSNPWLSSSFRYLAYCEFSSAEAVVLRCSKKKMFFKIKFYMKDFFSKCDQLWSPRKLRIWLHLLKKFLFERFIFLYCVNGLNLRSVSFHAHSHFFRRKIVNFLLHAEFGCFNLANEKITVLVLFLFVTTLYHLDVLSLMIINDFHHLLRRHQ